MVNDRAGKHNTCKFFEWNYSKSFFYGGLKDNNRLQKKKKETNHTKTNQIQCIEKMFIRLIQMSCLICAFLL